MKEGGSCCLHLAFGLCQVFDDLAERGGVRGLVYIFPANRRVTDGARTRDLRDHNPMPYSRRRCEHGSRGRWKIFGKADCSGSAVRPWLSAPCSLGQRARAEIPPRWRCRSSPEQMGSAARSIRLARAMPRGSYPTVRAVPSLRAIPSAEGFV